MSSNTQQQHRGETGEEVVLMNSALEVEVAPSIVGEVDIDDDGAGGDDGIERNRDAVVEDGDAVVDGGGAQLEEEDIEDSNYSAAEAAVPGLEQQQRLEDVAENKELVMMLMRLHYYSQRCCRCCLGGELDFGFFCVHLQKSDFDEDIAGSADDD